jgi:hypothetical protein
MDTLMQKKEILDWISTLDNPIILNTIYKIKENNNLSFKERFENGLTSEEFKQEMTKRIKEYPNRK